VQIGKGDATLINFGREHRNRHSVRQPFAEIEAPVTTPLKPADATSAEIPLGRGRLQGKVILVCGAGCVGQGWGNGKATSVAYAQEGATVIAVDKEKSAADATVAIIEALGGRAWSFTADVTASVGVKAAVDAALQAEGRIDVLHNNVGTTIMGGPVELSEQDWQTVLDVNLKSAYLTCKHVLPGMIERGKGAIINTSSVAAIRYVGYPYSAYYAAKAGVNQFTVGLALQYARQGIRVNAIMPGLMNTPLIYQQISGQYADAEEMARARDEATPMGRMGTAWDVAAAAVFLASDEARYITGVCLPVDGGLTCRAA
jgi:NAD(P)-dependent dehydrogenase (short-subunit alcohol dehydrogenase family)